jgi:ubiquinone/menaquinone biosynthesis C-methylase UbiE
MIDKSTLSYFDEYTREYSTGRLKFAVEIINELLSDGDSLVDIGCGAGNVLEFIKSETGLKNLCGIDISDNCLEKAKQRVGCKTLRGSVLDQAFIKGVNEKFRFAVLSAVLHHLVGKTRRESKTKALAAVENALRLVEEGGFLVILEPTFRTSFAMACAFYIKKLGAKITKKRINVFKAINLGPPVVSYLSHEELVEMIGGIDRCRIIGYEIRVHKASPLLRLALITKSTTSTLIVHKQKIT